MASLGAIANANRVRTPHADAANVEPRKPGLADNAHDRWIHMLSVNCGNIVRIAEVGVGVRVREKYEWEWELERIGECHMKNSRNRRRRGMRRKSKV